MIGEWCYFKSYFDRNTCENIIKEGLKIQSQEAMVGVNDSVRPDTDSRRSKIRFINSDNTDFTPLFDDIWKMAIKANHQWFNFHITRLPFLQLAEYDSAYKGEYKQHQDVFWINGDPFYHRKLTCVIQLTDPSEYEGGDFEVVDVTQYPNKEDLRQQGTAIFIPSFILHKANPVTSGVRHSIAAWVEGPKWR